MRRAHFDKTMANVLHEEKTTPNSRVILREVRNHWPDARVPYTMDEAFSADFKALIAAAMTEVHEKTCIRWVPKTDADTDFVHIYTTGASACVATLGYHKGHGKHKLELKSGDDGGCKDKVSSAQSSFPPAPVPSSTPPAAPPCAPGPPPPSRAW